MVRAGSTAGVDRSDHAVEKFLATRLRREATMFDPHPRLVGGIGEAEAEAMSEDDAWQRVRKMRWPDRDGEPRCPKCGSEMCWTLTARKKFKCKFCHHQFSAVSGTAYHSVKGGYRGLLLRISYSGPVHKTGRMQAKTAVDMRRRKLANESS